MNPFLLPLLVIKNDKYKKFKNDKTIIENY